MPGSDTRLIVGRHAVEEALAADPARAGELMLAAGEKGAAIARIIALAKAAGIKVRKVDRQRLGALSQGAAHQGVGLVMAAVQYAGLEELIQAAVDAQQRGLLVLADHIQDPHNLGAMIRSAAAAGAQGLIIAKDRACPLTPAVAKAAAGGLERLPVARVTNLTGALQAAKQAGLWALAAATEGASPPWELDLSLPLVLVVGGEQKGVGQRLLKACDLLATLPLAAGAESLNASVACAVLLFEIVRQRAAQPS